MSIKQLQQQLKDGKITKAQYEAELKKLLETEEIDQDEYNEAAKYTPAEDEKIYTQHDVDSIIAKKANQLLRRICRDAGVEIDGVSSKDLAGHVGELLKTAGKPGDKKEPGKGGDGAQVAKVKELTNKVKDLTVELAIYKNLGSEFKPINPIQVVRAIKNDYMDYIDVDEDGDMITVDRRSIDRALQKVQAAEPNLFLESEESGKETETEQKTSFSSKTPGGGKGNGQKAGEYERLKAEGLAAIGIKTETK